MFCGGEFMGETQTLPDHFVGRVHVDVLLHHVLLHKKLLPKKGEIDYLQGTSPNLKYCNDDVKRSQITRCQKISSSFTF